MLKKGDILKRYLSAIGIDGLGNSTLYFELLTNLNIINKPGFPFMEKCSLLILPQEIIYIERQRWNGILKLGKSQWE